jgi:DNA-binding response OmpR family regulator
MDPHAHAYRTVLVVDASADRGTALVAALVRRGLAATAVQAANVALRLAASRPPDAWIVDQALPGVSGAQLVVVLRASANGRLRDAVIVGTAAEGRAQRGFAAAGASAFLPRRASPDEVASAVDAALAKLPAPAEPCDPSTGSG